MGVDTFHIHSIFRQNVGVFMLRLFILLLFLPCLELPTSVRCEKYRACSSEAEGLFSLQSSAIKLERHMAHKKKLYHAS